MAASKFSTVWQKLKSKLYFTAKGQSAKSLDFVAITGTAGKTTVAHLLAHVLGSAGHNIGLISSQGSYMSGKVINTIPVEELDPSRFYDILEMMHQSQVTLVILEVTPNLILDEIVTKLQFEATLLTSLLLEKDPAVDADAATLAEAVFLPLVQTREHGIALLNNNDPSISWINKRAEKLPQKLYAAWCHNSQVQNLQLGMGSTKFELEGQEFQTNLTTEVNVSNTLLVARYALQVMPLHEIAQAMASFIPPTGRLEVLQADPFVVMVDNVREVAVIQKIMGILAKRLAPNNKLITVLGYDSDEDSYVGSILTGLAKVVILAPHNPGGIDLAVNHTKMVAAGEARGAILVERFSSVEEYTMVDKQNLAQKIERVIGNGDTPFISFDENSTDARRNAIHLAIKLGQPGDMIYLAGKGTDRHIIVGNAVYDWDEAAIAQRALHGDGVSKAFR